MSKAGHYCSGDFTSDEEQRKRTARTSSTTWSPTTWGRGHWTWGHGSGRPADRPKRSMSSLMSCFRCSVEMEVGSRIFAASLTVRITVSFPRMRFCWGTNPILCLTRSYSLMTSDARSAATHTKQVFVGKICLLFVNHLRRTCQDFF